MGKGFCEGGFGDQEPGSDAVAQNFDAFRPVGQGRDVSVFERVDPARMKVQMRSFVLSGWRPLIKGYFAAVRLIVGAVMSSACRRPVMRYWSGDFDIPLDWCAQRLNR